MTPVGGHAACSQTNQPCHHGPRRVKHTSPVRLNSHHGDACDAARDFVCAVWGRRKSATPGLHASRKLQGERGVRCQTHGNAWGMTHKDTHTHTHKHTGWDIRCQSGYFVSFSRARCDEKTSLTKRRDRHSPISIWLIWPFRNSDLACSS